MPQNIFPPHFNPNPFTSFVNGQPVLSKNFSGTYEAQTIQKKSSFIAQPFTLFKDGVIISNPMMEHPCMRGEECGCEGSCGGNTKNNYGVSSIDNPPSLSGMLSGNSLELSPLVFPKCPTNIPPALPDWSPGPSFQFFINSNCQLTVNCCSRIIGGKLQIYVKEVVGTGSGCNDYGDPYLIKTFAGNDKGDSNNPADSPFTYYVWQALAPILDGDIVKNFADPCSKSGGPTTTLELFFHVRCNGSATKKVNGKNRKIRMSCYSSTAYCKYSCNVCTKPDPKNPSKQITVKSNCKYTLALDDKGNLIGNLDDCNTQSSKDQLHITDPNIDRTTIKCASESCVDPSSMLAILPSWLNNQK